VAEPRPCSLRESLHDPLQEPQIRRTSQRKDYERFHQTAPSRVHLGLQLDLLLSRDGTRFVKLDARQNPVFMLLFGDTNFLRDDLTYKGGQMITLVLDVPVADEDILPFRLMCDYAKSLSERIGARVVDDQRRPLPESSLLAIEKQLMTLYAKLEQAGIPAGSPATRRLFSQ